MQTWQNITYSDFRFEFQSDLSGEIRIVYRDDGKGNDHCVSLDLDRIRMLAKTWEPGESALLHVSGDLLLSVPSELLRLFLKENTNDRVV